MNICNNCKNPISCGCQLRRASDGTDCCTRCLDQLEAKINGGLPPQQAAEVVQSVDVQSTDPTNIRVHFSQSSL